MSEFFLNIYIVIFILRGLFQLHNINIHDENRSIKIGSSETKSAKFIGNLEPHASS